MTPRSRATCAIGFPVSSTIRTAPCLKSSSNFRYLPTAPPHLSDVSTLRGETHDYCPDCCGVWLDRGELDKILERSLAQETDAYRPGSGYDGHGSGHGSRGGEHGSQQYGSGRRRGSWLGELFGG
ncbi:TFIIB-type zinc ribbon-containing protein [Humibacter ginsengiterrae]